MRKFTLAVTLFAASAALAEGTVQQKTKFHMGGGLGAVVNVFGGKATREGVESTIAIKGNRKSTRHGSTGEIVDLSEEKIYRVDYDRKTYTVTTFDDLRKQFEDARKSAERDAKDADKNAKNDGPEYVVEFDVKSTGNKETINGFATRQEIATITVHEKGKKIEQSGGVVLTADMAIGPKIDAMNEIADFDRRFFMKVYGNSFSGADMQQMAALLSRTPALARAMKEFAAKSASFKGTPIRTMLNFESVAGTEQSQQQAEASSADASAATAIVGGFLNKMKNKRAEKNGTTATAGRSSLFDSTTEILSVRDGADNDAVTIPAGFKKR